MSWSIYLSGSKETVVAELRNAYVEIRHALDVAEDVGNENLAVSVSGHGYKGSDGSFSMANSFTVDGLAPPQAVAVQEVVEEQTLAKPDFPF